MPNLRKFLKEIKMAGKGNRVSSVGIEFGSSSIKLVKFVEDRGVIRLDNYGEIALGPFVDKASGEVANLGSVKLQAALSQLLNNMEISTPDAISVAIPLSATLIVPLELDLNPQENLENKVMEKVKEEIPVPLDQVFVDWQEVHSDEIKNVGQQVNPEQTTESNVSNVSNKDASAGSSLEDDMLSATKHEVICYVINKDVIQSYTNVLSGLGQQIDYFELEIYSVIRSALKPGIEKAIVVDIGAKYTKLYAIKYGEVCKVHKKLHGGIDYTNTIATNLKATAEKAESIKRSIDLDNVPNDSIKQELIDQVEIAQSTIKSIRDQANMDIDTPIYLCGGGVLLNGLAEHVAKGLDAKVVICQPFNNVQAPEYLNKILHETGPEYAVSAGLAMKHLRVV